MKVLRRSTKLVPTLVVAGGLAVGATSCVAPSPHPLPGTRLVQGLAFPHDTILTMVENCTGAGSVSAALDRFNNAYVPSSQHATMYRTFWGTYLPRPYVRYYFYVSGLAFYRWHAADHCG